MPDKSKVADQSGNRSKSDEIEEGAVANVKTKKTSNEELVANSTESCNQHIQKIISVSSVNSGDILFHKLTGYPYWPIIVTGIEDSG